MCLFNAQFRMNYILQTLISYQFRPIYNYALDNRIGSSDRKVLNDVFIGRVACIRTKGLHQYVFITALLTILISFSWISFVFRQASYRLLIKILE